MYNADALNKMSLAQLTTETDRFIASTQASASMANAAMAAAAARYSSDMSAAASKYANDSQGRIAAEHEAAVRRNQSEAEAATLTQQTAHDHTAIVAGIINNDNIPPERRAALLESLGEHGLAGAMFVVDTTAPDLTTGRGTVVDNGSGG
jgi:hypothetical protein